MKRTLSLISAAVLLLVLAVACSAAPAPENCPELGVITNVGNAATPLNVDNLKGSPMPNLTWHPVDCQSLKVIDDQTLSLNDYRGKPVMIIFHKTMNCPGCAAEMPFILAAYQQRTNGELVILTVYREDKISAVRHFVTSKGYTFPALADLNDDLATTCGFAHGAPITIFVDANGVVKEFKCGPFQSQEEIENILKSL